MSSNISADGRKAGQYCPKQAHTLLCEAAKSDSHLSIVLALLNADTEVDDLDNDVSPLMYAAEYGSTEVIKPLIADKALVDRCNAQRETSVHIACKHMQWGAAKLLYDKGAEARLANDRGDSALAIAKEKHGVELLQYMAGKDVSIWQTLFESTSLSDACKYGYDLVARKYDIDSLSTEEIKDAVTQSCLSRSTALLEYFTPKLDDHSLSKQITQAYETGHSDCVDVLIKCCMERQDFPCPEISLVEACKHTSFTNLTYFLIEKGQDVNKYRGEPLRKAAEHGNINAVKHLIQFGDDVDMKNAKGETPLLLACKENHLATVDVLLNYTANVNIETHQKETPLTVSCKNGSLEIVNLLLSNNPLPDLHQQNKDGKTALEVTVDNHHSAIAVSLISKGASLPLKYASRSNNQFFQNLCHVGITDLVKRFLQAREDSVKIDGQVLDVVIRAGNEELIKHLLASDKVRIGVAVLVSALKCACKTGSVPIVKMITEYDDGKFWQSVQADNESHLYVAIQFEDAALVSFFINSGCIPGNDCPVSAAFRSKDILNLLLQYDIPTASLNTALMAVCRAGHRTAVSCARQLLEKSDDMMSITRTTG